MDPETKQKYEAAKARYAHPGVQRRHARIKRRDWEENTLPPSKVFARRLRETRKARRLSLARLSAQMAVHGHPISVRAIHEIETGKRRLSLDEAFALTEVLRAVPANMLVPPEGKFVRLGPGLATDGSGMRTWLSSGLAHRSNQPPAPEIADDVQREEWDRRIARLAQVVVDASQYDGGEDEREAQMTSAWEELAREVTHRKRKRA